MKHLIPNQKSPSFNNSAEYLHKKTQDWISEIEFIKVEQDFLKELLAEHIIGLCDTHNFNKAKLLLNGINHEAKLGETLIKLINEHNINLSLLIENIYLKKENLFRDNHESLKIIEKILNILRNKYLDSYYL